MFGNALGWAISAVVVGLAALFLVLLGGQGDISSPGPVGLSASEWKVQLPVEPAGLAGLVSGASDGGAAYQEALAIYETDRYEYGRYDRIRSTKSDQAKRWGKIVELVAKGSQAGGTVVLGGRPADAINYDGEYGKAQSLRKIGRAVLRLSLLHSAEGGKDTSRELAQAVFALGAKMYYERLTFSELDAAQELMGSGADWLATLWDEAGQSAKAQAFQDFNQARVAFYSQRIEPAQRAVMVLEPNAGDLVALAERGGDWMWRVEAILALGRVRFSAVRAGDQQGAMRVVTVLSNDGDPRIRAAARAARDLTLERFRKLR